MNARTQLETTLAQIAELAGQIATLNEKAGRASAVTSHAAEVRQQTESLKQQRRGLLARLFLGDGPADTSEVDAQIKQTEDTAAGLQDDAEAAQMALDTLQAQIGTLAQRRHELEAGLLGLRHAVLTEQAHAAADAYAAKVGELIDAYVVMAGAARAVNALAGDGKPAFCNYMDISARVELPVLGRRAIVQDVTREIMAAEQASNGALPG